MRHRVKKATLNKPADVRKAMMRNLLTSLFEHGHVQTTDAKARALSAAAEKLVTLVKRQKEDFNAIRELKRVIFTESSSRKALTYMKATTKTSGFVRETKIRMRPGDGALIVQVSLISNDTK